MRRLVPGGGKRLGGRGRRRVPARLPDPARPSGVLRGGAQHLPGRAARRGRLLEPPGRPGAGRAVRLGPARHAGADRVHEARRASAAVGAPRGARLRPRAAAGAAARDARGDGWSSCGRSSGAAARRRNGSDTGARAGPLSGNRRVQARARTGRVQCCPSRRAPPPPEVAAAAEVPAPAAEVAAAAEVPEVARVRRRGLVPAEHPAVAVQHRPEEQAGHEAAAEEPARERPVGGPGLPVGHLAPVRRRPGARLGPPRPSPAPRPPRRRAPTAARRPAAPTRRPPPTARGAGRRSRAAGARARAGPPSARGRPPSPSAPPRAAPTPAQVLRPPRPLERLLGELVVLDRDAVVLLGLGVRVGHVHVEVERADLLAERDHVVAGDAARLLRTAPPPPGAAGGGGTARTGRPARRSGPSSSQPLPPPPSLPPPAPPDSPTPVSLPASPRALPTRRTKSDSTAAVPSSRLASNAWRRELARLAGRQDALGRPGAERVADHRRVHARLADLVGDLAQSALGAAAGLVERRRRAAPRCRADRRPRRRSARAGRRPRRRRWRARRPEST